MARKAIYMGPRLKAMRREMGLTQANMADDLEVSASYIALMERNQRPVTAEMLLKLAATYRVDIAELAVDNSEETAGQLKAIFADPMFADIDLPALDIADIATSYPAVAEAIARMHTAFSEEQLVVAERNADTTGAAGEDVADPVSEARAFLAARQNYFPALEDSASELAALLPGLPDMEARLAEQHGLEVRYVDAPLLAGGVRWHDYHRRRIMLYEGLDHSARRFQLALQLAILEQGGTIESLVEEGNFSGEDGQQMARHALQSYWAAALLMPYASFHTSAIALRYDLDVLAARFGVSFEQAAHRVTTLQRKGAKGVPFFFLRVDRAGNVSKRLDGAGFPFARAAGGCPLWNIHAAFERPGKIDAQMVALPDGDTFVSIARTVQSGSRAYGMPRAMRSVALVCASKHAGELVYGDGLSEQDAVPIGIACRVCHRPRCVARSLPPLGREMMSNRFRDPGLPFAFSGE